MNRDPLLTDLGIIINRLFLFGMFSAAQAVALWLWFWMHFKALTLLEAARHLRYAWPMSLDAFGSVQAMGMLWIGCANTGILFLLLGRWWHHRADVLHRRGGRFSDERGEA